VRVIVGRVEGSGLVEVGLVEGERGEASSIWSGGGGVGGRRRGGGVSEEVYVVEEAFACG
jgi:hypothetical protein